MKAVESTMPATEGMSTIVETSSGTPSSTSVSESKTTVPESTIPGTEGSSTPIETSSGSPARTAVTESKTAVQESTISGTEGMSTVVESSSGTPTSTSVSERKTTVLENTIPGTEEMSTPEETSSGTPASTAVTESKTALPESTISGTEGSSTPIETSSGTPASTAVTESKTAVPESTISGTEGSISTAEPRTDTLGSTTVSEKSTVATNYTYPRTAERSTATQASTISPGNITVTESFMTAVESTMPGTEGMSTVVETSSGTPTSTSVSESKTTVLESTIPGTEEMSTPEETSSGTPASTAVTESKTALPESTISGTEGSSTPVESSSGTPTSTSVSESKTTLLESTIPGTEEMSTPVETRSLTPASTAVTESKTTVLESTISGTEGSITTAEPRTVTLGSTTESEKSTVATNYTIPRTEESSTATQASTISPGNITVIESFMTAVESTMPATEGMSTVVEISSGTPSSTSVSESKTTVPESTIPGTEGSSTPIETSSGTPASTVVTESQTAVPESTISGTEGSSTPIETSSATPASTGVTESKTAVPESTNSGTESSISTAEHRTDTLGSTTVSEKSTVATNYTIPMSESSTVTQPSAINPGSITLTESFMTGIGSTVPGTEWSSTTAETRSDTLGGTTVSKRNTVVTNYLIPRTSESSKATQASTINPGNITVTKGFMTGVGSPIPGTEGSSTTGEISSGKRGSTTVAERSTRTTETSTIGTRVGSTSRDRNASAGISSSTVSSTTVSTLRHYGTSLSTTVIRTFSATPAGKTASTSSHDAQEGSTTMTKTYQPSIAGPVLCTLSCPNGFCVIDPVSTLPRCQCDSGYASDSTGQTCRDVDECQLNQNACEHTCRNTLGSYDCACVVGYELNKDKRSCSLIDFCRSSPCIYGRCASSLNSFVCTCDPGWEGKQCDQDVNECSRSNPCSRHGSCVNTPGSYICNCSAGWQGPTCSQDINECQWKPCVNGSCTNTPGSYSCICSPGWTGVNCDSDIDECLSNRCRNGATCMNFINNFSCLCSRGYTGAYCEIDINDCASFPCRNGGVCSDRVNDFFCYCPINWQGKTCATDVDECSAGLGRCNEKATCSNTLGSYTCSCNQGYKGDGFTCRENRLFDYKGDIRATRRLWDFTSPLIDIPIGFPFDTEFYYNLYFTDNGVVVFQRYSYDPMYTFSYPTGFQASMPPMIAAFWADADLSAGYGEMYYRVYDFQASPNSNPDFRSSLESAINTYFTSLEFKALWAIKITWEKVPPYPAYYFSSAQTNTYQVLLATDGIYSFCLILFDDGGMNWNYYTLPSSYRPKMGYFSGVSRNPYVKDFPEFNDPQTGPKASIPQIYRPDQYRGNNTGQKGRWAYRLERNKKTTANPRQQCLIWYYSQPDPYPWWAFSAPPCPCTHRQARFDSSFTAGDLISHYGFEQKTDKYISVQSASPSWNGAGTRCYYSWNGALVYGEKERYLPVPWRYATLWSNRWNPWAYNQFWSNIIPLQEEYRVNEVDPYNSCCRDSGSSSLCGLYHTRRPFDFCWGYIPPRIGMFFGDPHINTLDEVTYTFNGLGEFILLNVKDENNLVIFKLQGRTARAGNGTSYATNFVGLAAAVDNGTQLFQVEWQIVGENSSAVQINGTAFDVTDNATYIGKVMLQKTENNEIQASFDGGISLTVSARTGALNFVVSLSSSYQNRTEGLMGIYNDDKRDDLMAANGTPLEFDGEKLPNDTQIFDMGMTWKTTPNNSIFQYNASAGESWYTYNNNSFVPKFYDELLRTTDSAMVGKANESCRGNEECVFDILSTGDFAVGEATLQSSDSFKVQISSMENFPPNITGPSVISTRLNEPITVQYVATDPNNDTIVFSLDTNSNDIRIIGNGTLTWHPTSSSPLHAIVRANDSKVTQELFLSLILCNCSNNATCLFNRTTGNNTDFVVAGCDCTAAWSGQYCSDDFDACVENNCYDNSTCQDNPAPKEGFTCGSCPEGLTGNGIKCSGIDECYENKSTCQQICINTLQGYNCSCETGFRVSALSSSLCDDIDECAGSSPCIENTKCINNPGSYVCECKTGYTGNPSVFCADINECANPNSTVCPDTSLCINTDGSYQCDCFPGYREPNCTAQFPCNSSVCNGLGECYMENGIIACACHSGYHQNSQNKTLCENINECDLSPCDTAVGICVDTPGSYSCSCESGYRLNRNNRTCENINECAEGSFRCPDNTSCEDTQGNYICVCSTGYSGTLECVDVNECEASGYSLCGNNSRCVNTLGSYYCLCLPGYEETDGICSATSTTPALRSGTTQAPSCGMKTCPPNYCSNGGNCSLTGDCEPICKCPQPFKDKNCELAGNSFMPEPLNDIPRRTIRLFFSSKENLTDKIEDVNSSVALIMESLPMKAFQANSNITLNATEGNLISEFNYSGNITVITFLNEKLRTAVENAFKAEISRKSRTTVKLNLSRTEDVITLPVNKLKDYFTCDSIGYSGYELNIASFMCESLCTKYCQNGGVCSHTKTGPVCSCVPFSIYIPFGDRCQDLSMNLGAFFGILFGSLAFLFLLGLVIILTVYCCRRKSKPPGDAESLLKTDFLWKANPFRPFSKMKESFVWSTSSVSQPTLKSWQPRLDKVDPSIQCKIKRPSLKTGAGKSEE
ncbi:uncharacterized protein LOC115478588 isoform X2 [Microcaecilia unicolor]|uniref:Uncharacterized protein LOC115478588 isoform X2 n=1 Tax=Microcaecilia unicolor TaxID=1415580 RepID=A0A6P7Z5L4_9AMPH|nr:uncharacterized protein LOC115478588 isoform X2 [Microcaecilia unicolor]